VRPNPSPSRTTPNWLYQSRDDLRLSGDLQAGILGEKLLLTNQVREKLDLLTVQCIVDIAQPLIFVLIVALRLVAKKQYGSAARARPKTRRRSGGTKRVQQKTVHGGGQIGVRRVALRIRRRATANHQ
jgi:hypothetical protein